ncbi:MAG: saccharopine dehydrogenase NADP-binding domain-containing protein [Candidatus Marinimicrobia bacterium]|jgi:saccharopine dehydrogenase (NAD+, L-lysine-forming)|nr:saccharopine dehydrogenase NADP-binding domain-containing protein [Candidatus Neomarinimicrobiota bacterium]
MKENITILVLGGYGGTGKVFCRYLLKETNVNVIVAGRRLEKAEELADKLKKEFLADRISARYADASDVESLRKAFHDIDFVLVAATTTKWANQIAETALETSIDYLDIYYQQDIYPLLETINPRIKQAGRCFITQAGFHPGLPAVYVRKGAQYFDRYDKAIIAFAMNARIEESESVLEIVDSIADYKPEFYQDGKWRIGTYKDAIKIDYGKRFGVRSSMPLDMVEIKPLPEMFRLRETGVFTTGFNWFTDYLLFPLMMLSHKIKKGSFRHFWAKLLIFGINRFSSAEEGVVFLLQAEGEKDGTRQKIEIFSEYDSGYDFTVIPVIACLKQYFDGSIRKPGLWMMGHLVDHDRLLGDMEKMGVKIQTLIADKDAS